MNVTFALVYKLAVFCLLLAVCRSASAATFVVTTPIDRLPTNFSDMVPGTLRGAIMLANANPNRDTITFASGITSFWWTTRISLVGPLPFILHPVVIDAAPDDPQGRGRPPVEIAPGEGLSIDEGLRLPHSSVLRGVSLFGFTRQLVVVGQSNLVDFCNFGCTSGGADGPYLDAATGIQVLAGDNRITRCVVAGNGSHGILLETASNSEVLGNLIGVNAFGDLLGNGGAGITIDNSRTNVIGRGPLQGNIIVGNRKGGIIVGARFPDFSTRSTVIEGNVIGLIPERASEFNDPGNGSHGIAVYQQRQLTIRNNQFYANHGHGVLLQGSSVINTLIEGNYFGSYHSGSGVYIFLGSQNVVTNNAIFGNMGSGIHLDSSSVNRVVGNELQANSHAGLYLSGPNNAFSRAADNLVQGNLLSGNGGPGIVQHGNASQNRFFSNRVINNGGLGIDLGGTNEFELVYSERYDTFFTNVLSRGDGPDAVRNDPGAYWYQSGVMLTNVTLSNSVVRANGYFLLAPQGALVSGGLYLLEFHTNAAADPSGFGEGEKAVGTFLVGPISSFNASTNFSAIFTNAGLQIGDLISATVTRTNGTTTGNQTSEFSNGLALRSPSGNNRPPVAVGDFVVTDEDQPVEFAVKANDFEPDGDTITVESAELINPALGFGPVIGSVTLLPNQRVRFVPAANVNAKTLPGPANVRYVINDGRGLKARGTAAIHITPINDPPRAFPDLATTRIGLPVPIQAVANDVDPDGDPLTITGTTLAGHGSVLVVGAKRIDYTPVPGYAGIDTFNYSISDGVGGNSMAAVTVLVRDDATRADLAVMQAVEPASAATNVPVTFRLTVTNAGPLDAAGVVLQVNLSSLASVRSLASSQGAWTNTLGKIRFDLGLIPSGASASATVVAASDLAGSLVSSATVLSLVGDSFPQNDRVTTSVSVTDGREPALVITRLEDRIRLSWDATAGTFSPEYRLDLGQGMPWRLLSGTTSSSGNEIHMDIVEASLVNEPFLAFRLSRR